MTDAENSRARSGRWSTIGWIVLAALTVAVGWRAATDYVDFPIYYNAGRQILQGNFELYPAGVYTSGLEVEGHGYRYAPGIALCFVPLAAMPYHLAAGVFFILKVLAFAHAMVILSNRLDLRKERLALTWVVLAVSGGYLVEEFRGGNVQFLVIYLLVYAFDRTDRGKLVGPAASLGIAVATKLVPALVAGYLLLRRRVSVVIGAIATVALVAILPAFVWGNAQNAHLLAGFRNYSATAIESAATDRNYSIRGALNKVRPLGISARGVTVLWLGLAIGFLGVMAWAFSPQSGRRYSKDVEFALVLAVLPLLSPHSQRIYFSYLAVPAAVLFGLLRSDGLRSRTRTAVISALVTAAALGTVLPSVLASRRLSLAYMDLFPYMFAAAVILGALLFVIVDRRSESVEVTKLATDH